MDDGMERLRAMLEMPSYLLRNFRPKEHAAAYRQWLERYGPLLGIQPGEIDVTDEELMRAALRREAEREAARAHGEREPRNRWTYCGRCGIRGDHAGISHQAECMSVFRPFERLSEELQVTVARRYLPDEEPERAEGYGPPEGEQDSEPRDETVRSCVSPGCQQQLGHEGECGPVYDEEPEPAKRDPLGELRGRLRLLTQQRNAYRSMFRSAARQAEEVAVMSRDALDQRDEALKEAADLRTNRDQLRALAEGLRGERDALRKEVVSLDEHNTDLLKRCEGLRADNRLRMQQVRALQRDAHPRLLQLQELVTIEREAVKRQAAQLDRTAERLHRKEQAIEAVTSGVRSSLDLMALPRPYWTRKQFFDWMRDLEDGLRYGLRRYEAYQEELTANESEVAPLPEPYEGGVPEERFVEGDVYANVEATDREAARQIEDQRLDTRIDAALRA